jgi:type II secretory pathway component PulJ
VDGETGFALAEVMAALALLSVLGFVVASGFMAGDHGLRRVSDGARKNAELLQLDAAVRAYAQRVLTPYWRSAPQVAFTPGAVAVSYLDGSADAVMRVVFKDGVLTVGDASENVRFDGVQDAKMEIAPARDQGAAVLRLTVRLAGLEPFIILAGFGGRPFPIAASP